MTPQRHEFKFQFSDTLDFAAVEATLGLARIAAEALHGVDRVQMEAEIVIDRGACTIAIQPTGNAGHEMAVIFASYARREFGGSAVQMHMTGGGR